MGGGKSLRSLISINPSFESIYGGFSLKAEPNNYSFLKLLKASMQVLSLNGEAHSPRCLLITKHGGMPKDKGINSPVRRQLYHTVTPMHITLR